jgi:dTMP kinase
LSLFISFEGGEGSGKSTQAETLSQRLKLANIKCLFIHEPGHTKLGVHIGNLLKGKRFGNETISKGAELFLFAASRAELVTKILKPAIQTTTVIIADRYADSTIAYQGYGRQLPLDLVESINSMATSGILPDLTFLLDCPPEEGLRRVGVTQIKLGLQENHHIGRLDEEDSRRFEEEPMVFHQRIRQGYHTLVKADPGRWCVVDATQSEDDVQQVIWGRVQQLLESHNISIDELTSAGDLIFQPPSEID